MAELEKPDALRRQRPAGAAYAQYSARLHQYLRRLLRNSNAVPDIAQESFKRFLSRSEHSEVVTDPLAFLIGISRNVARELFYEEQRRRTAIEARDSSDEIEAATAQDAAEALAVQDDLVRALHRLPEAHLAVLMLVEYEGHSYEEAARLTGFTRNTVATYLAKARAELRTQIKECSQDSPP